MMPLCYPRLLAGVTYHPKEKDRIVFLSHVCTRLAKIVQRQALMLETPLHDPAPSSGVQSN
jgi:hypothetical protein